MKNIVVHCGMNNEQNISTMTREQKIYKALDTQTIMGMLNEYTTRLLDYRTDEEKEDASFNRLNTLVVDLKSELATR